MTMIARLADGLPLAASMQEDEQVFALLFVMYNYSISPQHVVLLCCCCFCLDWYRFHFFGCFLFCCR